MSGDDSRLKFKCFSCDTGRGELEDLSTFDILVIVHFHYTYIRGLYTQKIKIFSFSWRALNIYPHLDKLFTTRIRNLQNFCFVFCTKSFQSNILFSWRGKRNIYISRYQCFHFSFGSQSTSIAHFVSLFIRLYICMYVCNFDLTIMLLCPPIHPRLCVLVL